MSGLGFALAASGLWGLGGVAAQDLFQHYAVEPRWLVTMRLLGGGLLLVGVTRPRWPRKDRMWLVLWSIGGVAATQLLWFLAIDHSNVAVATFIQYLYVALTAGWQITRREVSLTGRRLAAIISALAGVAAVVFGGSDGFVWLHADWLGVAFALGSAATAAFMFIGSVRIVKSSGALFGTTWALVIGAVPMVVWSQPWNEHLNGDLGQVALLTTFVVVASTALAFVLAFASLRWITPTDAALLSTFEPIVAAVASLALLGVRLAPVQYVGGGLIVSAILMLATASDIGEYRGKIRRGLR
jgi:drug/metabolite transporter (DMT)-like permease